MKFPRYSGSNIQIHRFEMVSYKTAMLKRQIRKYYTHMYTTCASIRSTGSISEGKIQTDSRKQNVSAISSLKQIIYLDRLIPSVSPNV